MLVCKILMYQNEQKLYSVFSLCHITKKISISIFANFIPKDILT